MSSPDPNDDTREEMAGLVAKWRIPPPGSRRTKARATKAEMEERRAVTRWLIETAGRALSRRGVAYRAEALLGLPKTVKAFRYIEEATLDLRDEGVIPWPLIRDGRRSVIPHSRGEWGSVDEFIEFSLEHALGGYDRNPWLDADVQGQAWIEKEDLADALADDDEIAAELDAVDALYPGLLGEWLADAIEPYCPAELRAATAEHVERTEERLAGLTVKLNTDEEEE